MAVTNQEHLNKNENRNMVTSSYGDGKFDKSVEVNKSMSISPSAPDELENKIIEGK